MPHIDFVCTAEGTENCMQEFEKKQDSLEESSCRDGELSVAIPVSSVLEVMKENPKSAAECRFAVRELDLNASNANTTPLTDPRRDSEKQILPEKRGICQILPRGIGVDLNADAVSSSVNDDSLCPSRCKDYRKSSDMSDCGSSAGSYEEVKDPMTVWKGLKQNGFLSSPHSGIASSNPYVSYSYGGIPVPRKGGKKNKDDIYRRQIELAKRAEIDKFAKMAAPSGLLKGLNPGIINHVRNKKQVHSIIQALVRSEDEEKNKRRGGSSFAGIQKIQGESSGNCSDHLMSSCEDSLLSNYSQVRTYSVQKDNSFIKVPLPKTGGCGAVCEDDSRKLKMSSLSQLSENSSSPSHTESLNYSDATVTVKAASVASQWLDLLHQDVKGRLMALRRSRKRVGTVINTELPFLIRKEFSSNNANRSQARTCSDGFSNGTIADMHRTRWTMLFNQMNQALEEEERQLEAWLDKVKELQLHCDRGLQKHNWSLGSGILHFGKAGNDPRAGILAPAGKEWAVQAAAASVYSTCNFLLSKVGNFFDD